MANLTLTYDELVLVRDALDIVNPDSGEGQQRKAILLHRVEELMLVESSQTAAAPPGGDKLIASYEDGTHVESSLAQWIIANCEDEECLIALERMRQGWTVKMGGGAQPLCRMWIERS